MLRDLSSKSKISTTATTIFIMLCHQKNIFESLFPACDMSQNSTYLHSTDSYPPKAVSSYEFFMALTILWYQAQNTNVTKGNPPQDI